MDKTQQDVQGMQDMQDVQDVVSSSGPVLTDEEVASQQKKEKQKKYNNTRKARIALLKKTHTFYKSTGQRVYLLVQDPVTKEYTSYISPGGHKWPPRHRKIKAKSFPCMIEHTTAEFDCLPKERWGLKKQIKKQRIGMHWKTKQKLDGQKKRDAEAAKQADEAQNTPQQADEEA